MKFTSNFLIGIGSNFFIFLLVMMLLPAFLITDHVDIFDKVTSYFSEDKETSQGNFF